MIAETDDRHIEIQSMSCTGDALHLFINDHGEPWITFEDEDRASKACFGREQMLRLKDWLNMVQL